MEFDGSIYPSRMFIRFTAHNQLMAGLNQPSISTFVQPDGDIYLEAIAPTEYFDIGPLDLDDRNIYFNNCLPCDGSGLEIDFIELLEDPSEEALEWEFLPLLPATSEMGNLLDETLLEDIATTIFSSNRYPELYWAYKTKEAVAEVEFYIAQEIVTTYRQILARRESPIVQRLNQLLSLT